MTLWLILAALLAVVLGLVLWPLLRPPASTARRADYDIEVYLDQLRELDRDAARGIIDEAQAAAARIEIERRLLAASRSAEAEAPAGTAAARGVLAATLAVAITAAAAGLYLGLGSPGLPNQPFAERPPAPAESPRIADARARLPAAVERAAAEPENPDRWRELGHLRLATGDEGGAVDAFAEAMRLSDGRADIASAYAEALTYAADGLVTPEAQRLFQRVLREDPGEPRARFFIALANYQAGLREAALEQWSALAKSAPAGAPWLPAVTERIRSTAGELGFDVAAYLPPPAADQPGPTSGDVAAAQNLSPEAREEMIRGMVERLAGRLESEPDDIEGWRRLGQSYAVLGEPDRSAAAYARALALEPDHPETLFRAGLAAAAANDRATAVGYFEHLRTLVPEDSEAYRAVGEAIERLSRPNPAE